MFDRNKKKNVRTVESTPRAQVFSYHASKLQPRDNPPEQASPRPSRSPGRLRRFFMLGLGVAALVYGLSLSTNAEVIILGENEANRRVLLQSQEKYQEVIRSALSDSLTSTNKITLGSGNLEDELKSRLPELEEVSIKLSAFSRRPRVYLLPAEAAFLVRSEGKVVVIDETGRVVADALKVKNPAKLKLDTVDDKTGVTPDLGGIVLPESDVSFITEVIGQLRAKKIEIESLTLPQGGGELDLKVKGMAYLVKFNLKGDAREEAGAYLAVKTQLERDRKNPTQYIDVRVENKAYYK